MFAFFHAQLKEHETQFQINNNALEGLSLLITPQGGLRFWKQRKAYPNGSLWDHTLVTLTGPRLALSLWDLI